MYSVVHVGPHPFCQRSLEVTAELGYMFDQVGILFPVFILPENVKTKMTYDYWDGSQREDKIDKQKLLRFDFPRIAFA